MKKIITYLALFLTVFTMHSCKDGAGTTSGLIYVRVKNNTALRMQSIVVNTGYSEVRLEEANAGRYTKYGLVNGAYPSAMIQMKIQGEPFMVQPIDQVGEESLPEGNYTYEVSMVSFDDHLLSVRLIRE